MKDSQMRGWLQLLLGLTITFIFFYMMAPFVVASLIGAVTTIVCYPIYLFLNKKLKPSFSALTVTCLITFGILLPSLFVLYTGSYKLFKLTSHLSVLKDQNIGERIGQYPWVSQLLENISQFAPTDPQWFRSQALEVLQAVATKLYSFLATSLSGMPTLMVGFLTIMLSVFFLLRDGERFLRFLSNLSPLKQKRSIELYHAFETSCRAVVISLFSSAIVQGVLIWFFFLVTGLPNATMMGMLSVGMGMVPIVGTAPIWGGAIIYFLVKSNFILAAIMILGGILISFSDNLVRMLIMQGKSDMHPFLALVSAFGAINLIGPAGIFLGPIVAAVFVSFLKILSQEIGGQEPLLT